MDFAFQITRALGSGDLTQGTDVGETEDPLLNGKKFVEAGGDVCDLGVKMVVFSQCR